MAIQKSLALVLRRQDLRETSLILTFFTKDFGKINGIVRGVRGERAQFGGGSLEIFSLDEIVFYERKRSDIYTVSQYDLAEFFNPVRESLDKLSYATYMMELLESVMPLNEPNSGVFDAALNSLKLLCTPVSAKRVARIFEIKILSLIGLMPSLSKCADCGGPVDADARFSMRDGGMVCKKCHSQDPDARPILPGTVKFMEGVQNLPFDKASRIKVAEAVGRELEQTLRRFLDFHIGRRLRTVEFIKDIERE